MIYKMLEKFFTLGHDFVIQNSDGQDVYQADGKFLSLGDKLAFRDMAGNELADITQKLMTWGHTYEISRSGQLMAVVKESMFTPLHHRFTIDVEGPDDLIAQGNFLDLEFTFTRGDRQVAVVTRKWFNIQHIYSVEVIEGEDDVLILASAVVIELVREPLTAAVEQPRFVCKPFKYCLHTV